MGPRFRWEKRGRLIEPGGSAAWLGTHAGSTFPVPCGAGDLVDLYVTGRDQENRSQIGRVRVDLAARKIVSVSERPVLDLGERGAFDENGVSYPALVQVGGGLRMYYVGWVPTVLTPFQNHIGAADMRDPDRFERVSRAPLLDRTDADPFSTGSCYVLFDEGRYRMWYTCFTKWGSTPAEPKHSYLIKYAESDDGTHWRRENRVCIDIERADEDMVAHPTVLRASSGYHMWYCYRRSEYHIGYAWSGDGLRWQRRDDLAGIELSESGWDSEGQAYPRAFRHSGGTYLLYAGNGFGRAGLGLACLAGEL